MTTIGIRQNFGRGLKFLGCKKKLVTGRSFTIKFMSVFVQCQANDGSSVQEKKSLVVDDSVVDDRMYCMI